MADKLITEDGAKAIRRLLVRMSNESLETPSSVIVVLPKSEFTLIHHMIDQLAQLPDVAAPLKQDANQQLLVCIDHVSGALQRAIHLMLTTSGPVPMTTIQEMENSLQNARDAFAAFMKEQANG